MAGTKFRGRISRCFCWLANCNSRHTKCTQKSPLALIIICLHLDSQRGPTNGARSLAKLSRSSKASSPARRLADCQLELNSILFTSRLCWLRFTNSRRQTTCGLLHWKLELVVAVRLPAERQQQQQQRGDSYWMFVIDSQLSSLSLFVRMFDLPSRFAIWPTTNADVI